MTIHFPRLIQIHYHAVSDYAEAILSQSACKRIDAEVIYVPEVDHTDYHIMILVTECPIPPPTTAPCTPSNMIRLGIQICPLLPLNSPVFSKKRLDSWGIFEGCQVPWLWVFLSLINANGADLPWTLSSNWRDATSWCFLHSNLRSLDPDHNRTHAWKAIPYMYSLSWFQGMKWLQVLNDFISWSHSPLPW